MRISAVSYLNTWPLVWGFQHGPQQGLFGFRFDLPAVCAAAVESGEADIGLVPCGELDRLGLDFLPDLGIACDGPVRSILLISKCPMGEIRTLAADAGSRTSVALARIILERKYGCQPTISRQVPHLEAMLAENDAALIIGDPALRLDLQNLPFETLDLGTEWTQWTGLPMVFAVWAGKPDVPMSDVAEAFVGSYRWGMTHLDDIVRRAEEERGFAQPQAREYLTRHIVYELTPKHLQGLELYREYVRALEPLALEV